MTPLTQQDYEDLSLCSLSESELLEELNSLQKGFTTHREGQLTQYSHEQKRASAYFQFYTPTNIPKLHFLLQRVASEVLPSWEKAPFIDFGAGPGTYTASWLSFFDKAQGPFAIVDKGEAMHEQAKKFLHGRYPKHQFHFSYVVPNEFLEDQNAVLFFGHVLNEMTWKEVKNVVDRFQGQAILWVEPGTSQAFQVVHKLRAYLLEDRFDVLYPCLRSCVECPATKREGEWCHQVLRLTWPEWIERMAQMLKIDRRTMPLITHAYQRRSDGQAVQEKPSVEIAPGDVRKARVVRLKKETKHSFEWEVCLEVEGQLRWSAISVMKRGLSKNQIKGLSHQQTGEKMTFEFVKLLEEKVWRVKPLLERDPLP